MKLVRIVSGGLGANTKVFLEDGSELKNVTAVRIELQGNNAVKATLEFECIEIDIVAQVDAEPPSKTP